MVVKRGRKKTKRKTIKRKLTKRVAKRQITSETNFLSGINSLVKEIRLLNANINLISGLAKKAKVIPKKPRKNSRKIKILK